LLSTIVDFFLLRLGSVFFIPITLSCLITELLFAPVFLGFRGFLTREYNSRNRCELQIDSLREGRLGGII